MNSPEQMFGQTQATNNGAEKSENVQKHFVVDKTTGLAIPYETPEEREKIVEEMNDRDNN